MDEALTEIREKGINVIEPDKEPFREAVQPLIAEYQQDEAIGPLLEQIISSQ